MSGNTNAQVLLAGGFAAFTVDLLVYPLDTLKTRYQSRDYKKLYYDPGKNVVNRALLFRGLYQGVGSIILVTLPSSGIFFTTYEALKSGLMKVNPMRGGSSKLLIPQPVIDGAASSVAELVACLVITPAEVIKQNAQMVQRPAGGDHLGRRGFRDSPTFQTLKTFKKPSQLFRGYTALVARNLPFTAMQFPLYEHLKTATHIRRKENGTATGSLKETAAVTAVSAGTAGSLAAFITTPVDVVKTRMMLAASQDDPKEQKKGSLASATQAIMQRKGGVAVAREILAENGVKGLFRGGLLRSVWTAFGSGLYLAVYESGRLWLGGRQAGRDE